MKLRNKIGVGILLVLAVAITSLAVVLSYSAECEPASPVSNQSETMKAVVYRCYGSPDVLEYTDVEKPTPADDEVLVKVRAAAVNPLDWHYMRGSPYLMRLSSGIGVPTDTRLGVDFAGIVEVVGANVDRYKPGDEVFGGASGAFAEYVTIREDRALALKPANVSFEQAASVPIAAVTALQALRDHGKLEFGQNVLINGASGGVGSAAVQLARRRGAAVIAVASQAKWGAVERLGAHRLVDRNTDLVSELGEDSVDVIVDVVGGPSWPALLDILRKRGRYGTCGAIAGPIVELDLRTLYLKDQSLLGSTYQPIEVFTNLIGYIERGEIEPAIARTYPLADIVTAQQDFLDKGFTGKLVLVPPDPPTLTP